MTSDLQSSVAADELRQIVERIEHQEAEKRDISESIKEIYAEAKGRGYDAKALRTIISQRKQDRDDMAEHEAILDMYRTALGMA